MNAPSLKDALETAVNAATAYMLDLNAVDMDRDDLREALSVLQETLPGMEEAELRSALETEDGYSLTELEKMVSDWETAVTETEWEEKAPEILSAFLKNLSLNGDLNLNPHYLYED